MCRYHKWRITVSKDFPKPVVRRKAYGLNTINLGRIYRVMHTFVASGGMVNISLVDDGGVTRTSEFRRGAAGAVFWLTSGYAPNTDLGTYAQLGTGTTPPTRTNTTLGTPIAGLIPLSASYTDTDVVTLTGSITYGAAVSPSEVGVFIEGGNGSGKSRYLIDRTVFSPLPAGTTFTVRVDIPLG